MNITNRILTFLGFFILPLSCFAEESEKYFTPVEEILILSLIFLPIIISIISMIIVYFCKKEELLEIFLGFIGVISILWMLGCKKEVSVVMINTFVSLIAMIFINLKSSLYKKTRIKILDVIIILCICWYLFHLV